MVGWWCRSYLAHRIFFCPSTFLGDDFFFGNKLINVWNDIPIFDRIHTSTQSGAPIFPATAMLDYRSVLDVFFRMKDGKSHGGSSAPSGGSRFGVRTAKLYGSITQGGNLKIIYKVLKRRNMRNTLQSHKKQLNTNFLGCIFWVALKFFQDLCDFNPGDQPKSGTGLIGPPSYKDSVIKGGMTEFIPPKKSDNLDHGRGVETWRK